MIKSVLLTIAIGLSLPIVAPKHALASCTTVPCQEPVKKKQVPVKEKYRCTVFDKASQGQVPCPAKKKQGAVKEKYRCTVFDKASQSQVPCPVKKKQGAVKEKYRCTVFDKASQSLMPCAN
jgi:hypothetical protein